VKTNSQNVRISRKSNRLFLVPRLLFTISKNRETSTKTLSKPNLLTDKQPRHKQNIQLTTLPGVITQSTQLKQTCNFYFDNNFGKVRACTDLIILYLSHSQMNCRIPCTRFISNKLLTVEDINIAKWVILGDTIQL